MAGKALFIPLKTEYFRQFASGSKTREYRRLGPRWNERTCAPGRAVILSHGYGRKNRLSGKIAAFREVNGMDIPARYWPSLMLCFGAVEIDLAEISVEGVHADPS